MTEPRYEVTLLQAAHRGDAEAIGHLLELAHPDIRRYAYLIFKAVDVNGLQQEGTWFQLLARKLRRAVRLLGLRGRDSDQVGRDEYLLLMPAEELRHDFVRAIQALPEHYRMIILLHDIEGRGTAEIGALLQYSSETVKEELLRARLMLSECLRNF